MLKRSGLGSHRSWEDLLGILLGFVIWLSPRLAGETGDSVVAMGTGHAIVNWNATIIGLLVAILASGIHNRHSRGTELAQAACGLWLIASPFALGYAGSGALRHWHFAMGALVLLLAMLELAQDWYGSDGASAHDNR